MDAGKKEWFQYGLATVVVLGEFACIAALVYALVSGIHTESKEFFNLLYGLILGYHSAFVLVVGYFFGSSKGRADKTDILKKAAPVALVLVALTFALAAPLHAEKTGNVFEGCYQYFEPTQAEVDRDHRCIEKQQANYLRLKGEENFDEAYKFAMFHMQKMWLLNNKAYTIYLKVESNMNFLRAQAAVGLLEKALEHANATTHPARHLKQVERGKKVITKNLKYARTWMEKLKPD